MENTDSVNELRSCSVISPCLFIVGSKDDRKTIYTAMSCQTDHRRSDRVEAVLTLTVKLAIILLQVGQSESLVPTASKHGERFSTDLYIFFY